MINPTQDDIGRSVVYRCGAPDADPEQGTITSFNDHCVFVKYGLGSTSAGTDRKDLEWLFGSDKPQRKTSEPTHRTNLFDHMKKGPDMAGVKQLFDDAKEASDKLSDLCKSPKIAIISELKFSAAEDHALHTRRQLSSALERFHGITLDDLQGI